MRAHLQALAASLGVGEFVEFVPGVPQDELFQRYSAAHVFLFPSLHDSGGNVVLEALAAGLPVVCLDLGGPSCFANRETGVVVRTADAADEQALVSRLAAAVASAVKSPQHWQQLHEGALARAQQLTWERQIAHIQSEIRRVLRLRGAPFGSGTEGIG